MTVLQKRHWRRPLRGGGGGGFNPISAAAEITAIYAAVSWVCAYIFFAHRDLVVLSGSQITNITNLGISVNLAQGVAGSQPVFQEQLFGTKPGIVFDGNDVLTAVAPFDATTPGYGASALSVSYQCDDPGVAGVDVVAEFGDVSIPAIGGIGILGKSPAVSQVETYNRKTLINRAQTAASFPISSPSVVTATGDFGLAANEAEIRVNGANATTTYVSANDAGPYGMNALSWGARNSGLLGLLGKAHGLVMAFGTGPIPVAATLKVEQIMARGIS